MRKNIVAGNWKMNTTVEEGVELASEINDLLKGKNVNCEVVVCVPFTHLVPVHGVIDEGVMGLGGENCSEHDKGAYTGEVSAAMVKSTGA
ncbi:MAG: triose-phosphate isomerase, partial [Muribaculaceae bacterium]|nr:triose-phosphate isomerase [Muribaculaceae bacterium]